MKTERRKIMDWLEDKMIFVYAIVALMVVGVIWIIGEIRLYLRTRHCKPKGAKIKL